MKTLVTAAVSVLLHVLLGWGWTILAGVVAGVWVVRRGWLVGALGVGLGWAALVAYNYAVAAHPVQAMTSTLGGILGNLPGVAVVGLTLLIGVLLGALGGALGTQACLLLRRRSPGIAA